MILSPHRDDAAFSLGLAVEVWLEQGHEVEVLNCCTESAYAPVVTPSSVPAAGHQAHITALRREEDIRWSRCYSRPVHLVDLSLLDAPQRRQCTSDEVCGLAVDHDDGAIPVIRAALRDRAAEALLLPLAVGNHVDHLTARIAAETAWPTQMPMAFYEDLPYAARPGGIAEIEERIGDFTSTLSPLCIGQPLEMAGAVARKRHLVLRYASQVDDLQADQIASFCSRYNGRERLWANSAWLHRANEFSS